MFFTLFIGLVLFLAILFCCEKDDDRNSRKTFAFLLQSKISVSFILHYRVHTCKDLCHAIGAGFHLIVKLHNYAKEQNVKRFYLEARYQEEIYADLLVEFMVTVAEAMMRI